MSSKKLNQRLYDSIDTTGNFTLIDNENKRHKVHRNILELNPVFEKLDLMLSFSDEKAQEKNRMDIEPAPCTLQMNDMNTVEMAMFIKLLYDIEVSFETPLEYIQVITIVDKYEFTHILNIIKDRIHKLLTQSEKHYKFLFQIKHNIVMEIIAHHFCLNFRYQTLDKYLDLFTVDMLDSIIPYLDNAIFNKRNIVSFCGFAYIITRRDGATHRAGGQPLSNNLDRINSKTITEIFDKIDKRHDQVLTFCNTIVPVKTSKNSANSHEHWLSSDDESSD